MEKALLLLQTAAVIVKSSRTFVEALLQEQLEVVEGGRWAETLRPLASLLVARWAEYHA